MFPPWLITIIAAALAFLTGLLLERFKNRIVRLKFKKNVFQLATAIQNNFWGNIEVLYNNRKTNHLSLITVEVRNDSNTDLEEVKIDFWVDNTSQMLAHQANYVESGNSILLEDNYLQEFTNVLQLNTEDLILKKANPDHKTTGLTQRLNWVLANKSFNLPVFNRDTSVKFQILVENFQAQIPNLTVSVLHKSCKLVEEENEIELTKTKNKYIGIIWILLAFVATFTIYLKFQNNPYAIIWAGISTLLSLYVALATYHFIKLIKRTWR